MVGLPQCGVRRAAPRSASHPRPGGSPTSPSLRSRPASDPDDGRVIPFNPARRRLSTQSRWALEGDEPAHEPERPARRRPRSARLLQREALNIATIGLLVVVLVVAAIGLLMLLSARSPQPTASAPPSPGPAAPPTMAASVAATAPPPAEPPRPTSAPAATPTAFAAPGVRAAVRVLEPTYTVQPGDTLASLAQRFNTTVDLLQAINNLPDRDSLQVGQKLIIP